MDDGQTRVCVLTSPLVQSGVRDAPTAVQAAIREASARFRFTTQPRACGGLDGAVWPHTTDLAAELSNLLTVASARLGPIERVVYDQNGWAPTPTWMLFGSRWVRLEGVPLGQVDTLAIVGVTRRRMVLLVVPPYTEPSLAFTSMMSAARSDNTCNAAELLGLTLAEVARRAAVSRARHHWHGGVASRAAGSAPVKLAARPAPPAFDTGAKAPLSTVPAKRGLATAAAGGSHASR